jgi:hypothetical protein
MHMVSCTDEVEAALDHLILARGGSRHRATDVNALIPNLFRRLRRQPADPAPELYELPRELFDQAAVVQRKVQLPPAEGTG